LSLKNADWDEHERRAAQMRFGSKLDLAASGKMEAMGDAPKE
jgi:hypothetical protein